MSFLKNRTVVGVICILLSLLICFGLTPALTVFYQSVSPSAYTKLRLGVCHKTVGEKDYCLVVLVLA